LILKNSPLILLQWKLTAIFKYIETLTIIKFSKMPTNVEFDYTFIGDAMRNLTPLL
jgi:hypothetical protein